jgi:hypothetical protein
MSKYFWFAFSARWSEGGSRGSKWMDERFSKQITIEDREYLSCDEVHVSLNTPYGSICSVDDIDSGRYSLLDSATLARYGADEDDVTLETSIRWRLLSNYGVPNTHVYVSSGGIVTGVTFRWTDKWHDAYWIVNSGRDGKLRRTRFSFTDVEGGRHYFYAVPWFGAEVEPG